MNYWKDKTIYDLSMDYLKILLLDYEKTILHLDGNSLSIEEFLLNWNCISFEHFESLKPFDKVYNYEGHEYYIIDYAVESYEDDHTAGYSIDVCSDDYMKANYSTLKTQQDLDNIPPSERYTFYTGDLYTSSTINDLYEIHTIKKQQKEKNKICPILITKTNQPQN